MSIKRIFIVISAIFAASAVFADNSSVTSKKYVDDLMSGYQGKLPGSGANTLMIYDDETGIGEKSIAATLGNSASAVSVPTVGAVKTGLNGKQDTITGTAGYVMTGTGTPGEVGEKPIYSTTVRDEDSLVTAESVNSGVINAVNSSLRRVNANGEPDNNGTLWEIADTVVALSYLPAGYTQLEYIESTGTQYIDPDINITPTNIATFKSEAVISNVTRESGSISGYSSPSSKLWYGLTAVSPYEFYYSDGHQEKSLNVVSEFRYYKYVIDAPNRSYSIYTESDEAVASKTGANFSTPDNFKFYLFTYNPIAGSASAFKPQKIKYAKFWFDGTLVRNMIPASKVENNVTVVGMYDTVSGQFFPDDAGGNFIAGPAVGN